MNTIEQIMHGNNILARHFGHPVEYRATIEDEDTDDGYEFNNHHITQIRDKDVLDRIITTSIIEIIN